jgi:hypothetical protein
MSAGNRWICTLALASIPAFGASSIGFAPGDLGTAIAPNSSPYNTLRNYRFEGRIHNWSAPSAGTNYFFQAAAGNISIDSSQNLHCVSNADSTTREAVATIAGYSDFLFRCQRDATNSRMLLEVWNYNGTNYLGSQQPTAPSPQPVSWSGALGFGSYSTDPAAILSLAYFRWYSTVLPLQSGPPTNASSNGDLGDWEFSGNTLDSSGNGMTIGSWSGGTPTYSTTPVYGPAVYLVNPAATVRAGTSFALNASSSFSLSDNPTLTFVWQLIKYVPLPGSTATSQIVFGTQNMITSSVPTLALPVAGTYYLQLTVTDSNGLVGSQTVIIGSVATDLHGVVIVPEPNTSFLLGPLTMWGTSPWPWYDSVEMADANAYMSGVPSTPPWGANGPGTISVTNGSQTVVGSGTSFLSFSACNGTDQIIVFYVLTDGTLGARPYTVQSCADNTRMTISQINSASTTTYDASASQSGLGYALIPASYVNWWVSGSNNWNYYDVVLALYRLYYRTSLDVYLTAARQLADNWWIYPLDGGRAYNNGAYPPPGPARGASLLGMMMRALDGQPGHQLGVAAVGAPSSVAGIKGAVDTIFGAAVTAYFNPPYDPGDIVDGREIGYGIWDSVAYAYLFDSSYDTQNYNAILGANSLSSRYHAGYGFTTNVDPTSASGGLTAYGYSGPNYQGSLWFDPFLFKALIAYASTVPADYTATLTVLQNSFNAWFTAHYFAGTCQGLTYSSNYVSCDVGRMPVNPSAGVPVGSVAFSNGSRSVTGTSTAFTANPPWQNTGSDYIGLPNGNNGSYVMLSVGSGGVTSATALTAAANYVGTLTGAANNTWGYAAACASPSGVTGAPANTYSTEAVPVSACSAVAYANAERSIAEIVHEVNGYLYQQTGNAQYKTQGDALFAAGYGCGTSTQGCLSGGTGLANAIAGGGPGADLGAGNFGDLLVYPVVGPTGLGKEFGSNSGAGRADTYLAYRLGGLRPPDNRPVRLSFNLATVPGATQVRVTVTQPSGVVTLTNCSTSPCSVTVDFRQGNHLMKLDYLTATGALASSGVQQLLKVD